MSCWALWIFIVLLIGTAVAVDVPFVFDEASSDVAGYSSSQLEQAHISSLDLAGVPAITQVADNDVLDFPITGGGDLPERSVKKNVSDLKKTLDAAVEPDNPRVHEEALVLALKYPGEKTIDQISSIYDYMKNGDESKKGWGYVSDPRGLDYFNYANMSLKAGDRAGCVGGGDCDDFAILMSALVESVGGTTRIILARNITTGGHAYAEVYLGQLNVTGSQVETIVDWLKGKFDTDKIYTHVDTDTKDVWLNLDWGPDEKGNAHPGGPFFQGDKHIVLCIRDKFVRTPLKLPEQIREPTQINLPEQNQASQESAAEETAARTVAVDLTTLQEKIRASEARLRAPAITNSGISELEKQARELFEQKKQLTEEEFNIVVKQLAGNTGTIVNVNGGSDNGMVISIEGQPILYEKKWSDMLGRMVWEYRGIYTIDPRP